MRGCRGFSSARCDSGPVIVTLRGAWCICRKHVHRILRNASLMYHTAAIEPIKQQVQVHELELTFKVLTAAAQQPTEAQSHFLQSCIRQHFTIATDSAQVSDQAVESGGPAVACDAEEASLARLPVEVAAQSLPYDPEPGAMTCIQVRIPLAVIIKTGHNKRLSSATCDASNTSSWDPSAFVPSCMNIHCNTCSAVAATFQTGACRSKQRWRRCGGGCQQACA